MLNTVGLSSLDAMIDTTVPASIRLPGPMSLDPAMSETEALGGCRHWLDPPQHQDHHHDADGQLRYHPPATQRHSPTLALHSPTTHLNSPATPPHPTTLPTYQPT